jgi:hypothetical protein
MDKQGKAREGERADERADEISTTRDEAKAEIVMAVCDFGPPREPLFAHSEKHYINCCFDEWFTN